MTANIVSQIIVVAGVTYVCYQMYLKHKYENEHFHPSDFFMEVQSLRATRDIKKLSKKMTKEMLSVEKSTDSYDYCVKEVGYDFLFCGRRVMEIHYKSDMVDEVWIIVWGGRWLLAGITPND